MRKPYAPRYGPQDGQWLYQGRYYDENPRDRYEQDLEEWGEESEDEDAR